MSNHIKAEQVRTGQVIASAYGRRGFAFEVAYPIRERFERTPGEVTHTVWFAGWEILEHDPTHGRGHDTYRCWKPRTYGAVVGGYPLYLLADLREDRIMGPGTFGELI